MSLFGLVHAVALIAPQMTLPGPVSPGFTDPRIRSVPYSEGQVVSLPVAIGYAAVVAFNPDERVESVVVGDSAAWQVTASKRGDHVVVKPLEGAGATNMVVITGERRYVFLLEPGGGGTVPFVLRFTYPEASTAVQPAVATAMTAFMLRGDRTLFPAAMSDDGRRTTITWRKDQAMPAIFAVEKGGHERLVNGRMVDGSYVVEDVAPRFVFRLGRAKATAKRQVQRATQ